MTETSSCCRNSNSRQSELGSCDRVADKSSDDQTLACYLLPVTYFDVPPLTLVQYSVLAMIILRDNTQYSVFLCLFLSLFMPFQRAGHLPSICPTNNLQTNTISHCPFHNCTVLYFSHPLSALWPCTLHYRLEYMHTSFPTCHPSSFSLLPSNRLTIMFHQADLCSIVQLPAFDLAALYLS